MTSPAPPATPAAARLAIGWVLAASAVGFCTAAAFSWWLRWDRGDFVGAHLALSGTFLLLFFSLHPMRMAEWLAHWPRGLLAAAAVAAFAGINIASQPASPVPQGAQLLLSLGWLALVYGALDALLLNVLPVRAFRGHKVAGVAASIVVTLAYHAGFTEYHGATMLAVVLGNTLITLAYVLTGSPLAAVAAHVAMHSLAVLHGMEATLQLPPHYGG